jgi:putative transcriptional regulator
MGRYLASFLAYLTLLLLPAVMNATLAPVIAPAPAPVLETATPAPGMFLVARRGFLDPNFSQTVVYLLQHDTEATFGLVINRPSGKRLSDTLAYVADTPFASSPVYRGGPMDPDMLVMLMRNMPDSPQMRHVIDHLQASVSLQVLDRLLEEGKPTDEVRFYLGYAGWSPGRLEQELRHHYWYLVKGDPAAVFGPDADSLWQKLIDQLEPLDSSPGSGSHM